MQNADCFVNDIDGKSRDIYTYIIYQTDYTYKNAYKVKNMSKDSTDLFISYTIYPWQVDSKNYLQDQLRILRQFQRYESLEGGGVRNRVFWSSGE